MDKLNDSFNDVLDKEYVNLTKREICATLAFVAMRVFRSELKHIAEPKESAGKDGE